LANHGEPSSPVIAEIADFDRNSGTRVERLLFNNRPIILLGCLFLTLFLGFEATKTSLNASYDTMIPTHNPFIVNYFKHYEDLQSQENAVRIAVTANKGTITDAHYLSVLQHINDEVLLLPGVNRPFMTSLWTSNTRWVAVTTDGLRSGPVIFDQFSGSKDELAIVKKNIQESGQIGQLVSPDFTSSMIYVPLLERDNLTGRPLNYGELAAKLNALRDKYANQGVTLHIVGFSMIVGDMINGLWKILSFFAVSILLATAVLFWYTRCVRSTALVVTASLIAVVWQLGLLPLLGFDLTPYSILVPFLIFAIGMSHGAQKMNGVMQDIGRGTHPLVAARYTFRRLFVAGFAALTCDAVSFAVLMTIKIDAIQDLAMIASIGVAILIFTNLIMLPMLLSYTGVSKAAAIRSLRNESAPGDARVSHPLWNFLDLFTQRRFATIAIAGAVVLGGAGWLVGRGVQVGDLAPGAPELRQNSQYNRDNAYILRHYATGNDSFIVLVDTPVNACYNIGTLITMDDLDWELEQLPGVESATSIASFGENATMLLTEGSPKWFANVNDQSTVQDYAQTVPPTMANFQCDFDPIYVSLTDHKATTLNLVVKTVDDFAIQPKNQSSEFKISLAGGNAGVAAATNIVVAQANERMLALVYASVIVFCFITFRSWRAVICAVVPLVLTSILAQALMVILHVGIKVATLPVIALGVGIGVDYALYVLSILLRQLRDGATLSQAYHRTLLFTGKVVVLTGFTLAAGVVTWAFAPIKFQADMGLLLAFMFLLNMVGALILLPSLSYFLLPVRLFRQPAGVLPPLVAEPKSYERSKTKAFLGKKYFLGKGIETCECEETGLADKD
jgi:predicted RND superfamily exporter protein